MKWVTILLFPLVMFAPLNPAFADGSDSRDNYIAGTSAGGSMTTATNNVWVGVTAGQLNTTGGSNVGIGYGALRNLTTGRGNVAIGLLAGDDLTTDNFQLRIQNRYYPDNSITGDFSTGAFTVSGTWGYKQDINAGDSNSETVLAAESGELFYAMSLPDKRTYTLPAAVAGLFFDFFVADSDSVLITTASGDSLLESSGTAYKTTSSVAGTLRVVALDTKFWLMLYTLGTWTSY